MNGKEGKPSREYQAVPLAEGQLTEAEKSEIFPVTSSFLDGETELRESIEILKAKQDETGEDKADAIDVLQEELRIINKAKQQLENREYGKLADTISRLVTSDIQKIVVADTAGDENLHETIDEYGKQALELLEVLREISRFEGRKKRETESEAPSF